MNTFKSPSRGKVHQVFRTGAVTLGLVAAILLAGCSGLTPRVVAQGSPDAALEKPGNAESGIMANLHGTVEVKTGDGQWTVAQAGQTLKSGQSIRTGAMSSVTLAFYDGSRTDLGAEAEVKVDTLDASTSGARIIQLTQISGESQHAVANSDDSGSLYDVNTPSGNGSATSTKFTVMVLPGQFSQFWVEDGAVSVANENAKVMVVAGQTTIVPVGQPPSDPAFRVTGEGKVIQTGTVGSEDVTPRASAIDGQSNQNDKVTLCHATGSATNPYVEITVSVAGATHGHAKHSGDIIPAPAGGCPNSIPITPSSTANWDIAGQTFHTDANTVIFGNPQPGDWVSFEGRQLSDGSRYADRIELLSHSSDNQYAFIGKVESTGDTAWTVSSRAVQVNENTEIEAGLKAGDNVQVVGGMEEDGILWARRVSRTEGAGSNFRFAGTIASMGRDVWVISGIKVKVDENTVLNDDFVVGNPVVAEGVIKDDRTWLATSIDLVIPEGYRFEFIGMVQNINPWTVSGVGFDTADWTEIDADIKKGDKVRVSGLVGADGIWVAEKIELLDTEHATSFAFFGPVMSINPWNVGGVSLIVDERTTVKGEITLGEMVKVIGWILEDGTWLATEIRHTGLHLGQGCFLVSSIVQSINNEEIILVDGHTIERSGDLEVQGDLKEGSLVRYQFCVDKDGVAKIGPIIVVYQLDEFPIASNDYKVVICHIPPGNPGNRHTIWVGQPAVQAHQAHGDSLGPCLSEKPGKKKP